MSSEWNNESGSMPEITYEMEKISCEKDLFNLCDVSKQDINTKKKIIKTNIKSVCVNNEIIKANGSIK